MSRRRPFWFDTFFGEDDPFDKIWKDFLDEAMEIFKERDTEGPMYYGFSVSIGPDGKPVVNEFGNIKPSAKGPVLKEEIEPLVDVMDAKDSVMVCAELPGVDKNDIDLKVHEDGLTISVDKEKRRYYKEVSLPAKVKPETAKATYKNGVLEVVFEKVGKQTGRQIRIE